SIQSANGCYQLTLQDGQIIETDLVLSAVGLRPNIALAHCKNQPPTPHRALPLSTHLFPLLAIQKVAKLGFLQ
ncbi:hypothetical protein BXA18_22270, partial [Acinetobacter baumannii]